MDDLDKVYIGDYVLEVPPMIGSDKKLLVVVNIKDNILHLKESRLDKYFIDGKVITPFGEHRAIKI
jgi:hypothetical protein